ncbi:MAG: hypothetical protein O2783_07730 [Chloroflexi bacterium]|nr:hypothetical protein [Chloroflexota bacterium]
MARYKAARSFILMLGVLSMAFVMGCGGGDGIASMVEGRGEHAATLLNDGRLLVVGGRGSSALTSAEVYDPATGEWSSAGAMTEARYGHTLTKLDDGRVLVVGGSAGSTAEMYDPTKGTLGTWSSAGSMTYEHGIGHTATLLDDGKVLITGGPTLIEGTKRIAAFAELYDPSTGKWSLTGDMTEQRENHQAVLLNDGMVLVVGATSSDLYDPTTGIFTKVGDFAKSHDEQFTATLLNDGRVLVAGGGTRGRFIAPNTLGHVDIYDPSTGEWSSAADMTTKRWGHTATVLKDGNVLVMNYKSAELYNPDTNAWTVVGNLPQEHGDAPGGKSHTATLMEDGTVFIVGGGDVNYTVSGQADTRKGMKQVDVYDPAVGW